MEEKNNAIMKGQAGDVAGIVLRGRGLLGTGQGSVAGGVLKSGRVACELSHGEELFHKRASLCVESAA